jgi:hypothetical protein
MLESKSQVAAEKVSENSEDAAAAELNEIFDLAIEALFGAS